MPRREQQYDIYIDGHGYMLALEDVLASGARAWAEQGSGASLTRMPEEAERYGNVSPLLDTPLMIDDLSLGYAQERMADPKRYHYSTNIDARFPGKISTGPRLTQVALPEGEVSGNVGHFLEVRGRLYAFNDRYCFLVDNRTSTITTSAHFGTVGKIRGVAAFNERIVVGMGYDVPAWVIDLQNMWKWGYSRWGMGDVWAPKLVATTWTAMDELDDAGINLGYMAPFSDRLWASTADAKVRCVSANPMDPLNWSGEYPIGDKGQPITAMCELNETLYVGKQDGLYALNPDGNALQLAPELHYPADVNNCRKMIAWHGKLWVPHARGLMLFANLGLSGYSLTTATPGADAGEDCHITGRVTALAGDTRWLYAAVWDHATGSYIVAGREAKEDEASNGPMIWHPLASLGDKTVRSMIITGTSAQPRLYIGLDSEIWYMDLPRNADSPLLDGNCQFAQDGTLYLSRLDYNAPSTNKVFTSVEVVADRLNTNQYIKLYYRTDERQRWRPVGMNDGITNIMQRSPRRVLSFGAQGIGARSIELRVELHNDGISPPIVLRSLLLHATERPDIRPVITAVIHCADNKATRQQSQGTDSAAAQSDRLKALASTRKLVKLVDVLGRSLKVIVLPTYQEVELQHEGQLARETLVTIQMAPVTKEQESTGPTPWIWGVSKWGGGDRFAGS